MAQDSEMLLREIDVDALLIENACLRREVEELTQHLQVCQQVINHRYMSEERLLHILNNSPDGILVLDKDGMISYANPQAHRLLGRDQLEQQLFGHPIVNHESIEVDIIHPNAAPTVVEMRVIETDWEGKPAYIVSLRDMTERKHMEQALREREERFRLLAEHAEDVIYRFRMTRPQGFEYLSPSIVNVLGYTPQEYYDDLWLHLRSIHPDSRARFEEFRAAPATMREPLVMKFVRKDGTIIWIDQRQWPIFDDHGELVAIEGIIRDVTSLKRYEEELQQAWHTAQSATRAKSEFLAHMSHEIRTPMNAVIGMTSLLRNTNLTTEQQDYVETISLSGETLLTLINNILDLSKIEADKVELEYQPFDLRVCVEETLDLLAPRAAEKKLNLAYLIPETFPCQLQGDSARLRQVLVNLVNNAIKFTEKGEIFLSVGWPDDTPISDTASIGAGSIIEVEIGVHDTGIGIPSDRIERLFQPFSQADSSMTRKYGGTGLGLAISKRLIEMMRGSIHIESRVGHGSSFRIRLPLEVATIDICPWFHPHPDLTGRRVLIVDHNSTNCHVLHTIMSAWGMIPLSVASGATALAKIVRGEPFDVIILDMDLPDMNGLIFAQVIRNQGGDYQRMDGSSLPLIIWTNIIQRSEALRTGNHIVPAPFFLVKPVRPSSLYSTLIELFGTEQQPTSTPVIIPRGGRSEMRSLPLPLGEQLGALSPLRILLAEDNLINQRVTLRLLEKIGYRADVVSNGREALRALRELLYDVVLMDVQMPEMDGVEATHHIRNDWPPEKQPCIVAMTAHALQGDREWLLRIGMDDYVSKPVRIEDLIAALERAEAMILSRTSCHNS